MSKGLAARSKLKSSDAATASSNQPRRLIGVHLSTTGGVANAVHRASEIGANTLQIFSSSRACGKRPGSRRTRPSQPVLREMSWAWARWSSTPATWSISAANRRKSAKKSVLAFRGEIERALALGAEYLVVHPGSYRGMTRSKGWNWQPNPSSKPSPVFPGNRLHFIS